MKITNIVLLGAAACALGGCATVVNGTSQEYVISSTPEGATVRFTNGQTCTTPCTLEMRRKDDQRADFTLAGHQSEYVLVQSRLGGSTFGNILLGGGIGAVVDGSNGASNRLYPSPLNVRLVPNGSTEDAVLVNEDGEVIATVDAHNDEVRVDVAKTIGADLAGLTAGN